MYYRKLYQGTLPNLTDRRNVKPFPEYPSTINIYSNQTDVISESVVDILHDIGYPEAVYDSEAGVISLEPGCIFAIHYGVNSQMSARAFYNGTTYNSTVSSSGVSYQPFHTSNTTYKFYITVIGEPKEYMQICFGSNTYPTSTSCCLHIVFGKHRMTNKDVMAIALNSSSVLPVLFFTGRYDITLPGENHTVTIQITGIRDKLILIPQMTLIGTVEFNEIFMGNSVLSAGQSTFYTYNGEVYWVPNSNMIVRCRTPLSVS